MLPRITSGEMDGYIDKQNYKLDLSQEKYGYIIFKKAYL